MRRSWPVLGLLAAGLLLLVTLYLPWQRTSCSTEEHFGPISPAELLFGRCRTLDGWTSWASVAPAAALFALLLAAFAAAAIARPGLVERLPLGRCALLAGYFGLAVGAETRRVAAEDLPRLRLDYHYAYGMYLGIAAVVLVLAAAAVLRRRELIRRPSLPQALAFVPAAGLLTALLLPWLRVEAEDANYVTLLGIENPAAVVAASIVLWLTDVWSRDDAAARIERIVLSGAAVLFTAAAFHSMSGYLFGFGRDYGAWFGLGFAVTLLGLSLVRDVRLARSTRPPWYVLASAGAATLFVTSLFLPWQRVCEAGSCVSASQWRAYPVNPATAAAALLAIAIVGAIVASRRLAVSALELAVAYALLVATLGFNVVPLAGPSSALEFAYGAVIGLVAAAVLVGLVLLQVRLGVVDRRRVLERLLPILLCAVYLVVVVVPWWNVLPFRVQRDLRFGELSWLTIAGALLAIGLVGAWARRITDARASTGVLVLLPSAMLALAAVDLVLRRSSGIVWGGGVAVGLCVVLAGLGYLERRGGLKAVQIPEILRIDRL